MGASETHSRTDLASSAWISHMDRGHDAYYEILPIHPGPQVGESLTSYLTRLAEANCIRSISGLAALCFPGQDLLSTRKMRDLPIADLNKLSRVSLCTPEQLLRATFYHLALKFGYLSTPQDVAYFLLDSLALLLRYCPICLGQEIPYYRLTWRFVTLPGCMEHDCKLLDQCGFCGQKLFLFKAPLRIGICPSCGINLRNCYAPPLSKAERETTYLVHNELETLLAADDTLAPESSENNTRAAIETTVNAEEMSRTIPLLLGERFTLLRQMQGLYQRHVQLRSGLSDSQVLAVERGDMRQYRCRFRDYQLYARVLKVTLPNMLSGNPGLSLAWAYTAKSEHLIGGANWFAEIMA
jgi:hypothetical protein